MATGTIWAGWLRLLLCTVSAQNNAGCQMLQIECRNVRWSPSKEQCKVQHAPPGVRSSDNSPTMQKPCFGSTFSHMMCSVTPALCTSTRLFRHTSSRLIYHKRVYLMPFLTCSFLAWTFSVPETNVFLWIVVISSNRNVRPANSCEDFQLFYFVYNLFWNDGVIQTASILFLSFRCQFDSKSMCLRCACLSSCFCFYYTEAAASLQTRVRIEEVNILENDLSSKNVIT